MSILHEIESPPFYAVVYTSPPKDYDGANFAQTASMVVALAAVEPGYLGFETEYAAEGRTVAVCYWDTFAALHKWKVNAEGWMTGEPEFEEILCTTGCLWPWLAIEHQENLEMAARRVA